MSCTLIAFTILLLIHQHACGFVGETKPINIEIGVGGSANITCSMNKTRYKGCDSTTMYFESTDTGEHVPHSDIAIIDDSEIVYMIRNATVQNRYYSCKCGKDGIGYTHVAVGTKPLNVTDFRCISYDYEYMVCNFTKPSNNLPTIYELNFMALSPNFIHSCTLEYSGNWIYCNLTLENSKYRRSYEYYNFTLNSTNKAGSNEQHFRIYHDGSVMPAKPHFVVESVTTNSIKLERRLNKNYFYKSNKLLYEIMLQPQHFGWRNYPGLKVDSNDSITIENLPYPYYNYKLRIRVRVTKSSIDGPIWSDTLELDFQTKPTIPAMPPKTEVGSFYIDTTETWAHLYWEQIPFEMENGPDFKYDIGDIQVNGTSVALSPYKIDRTSAVLPFTKYNSYKFIIYSSNRIGRSVNSSEIYIPAFPVNFDQKIPTNVKTVAANRTYKVSWNPPVDRRALSNYTVFWCESIREKSNECNGTVHFKTLLKEKTSFTIEEQHNMDSLSFAVSANYPDMVTGMHWMACVADVTSDLVRFELEKNFEKTKDTIKLQWTLDMLCTSHIEGYNLTYCERDLRYSNDTSGCGIDRLSVNITESARSYILRNLKPYTEYKIGIFMYSKTKDGITKWVVSKTLADAPTVPRNLRIHNVTSNSAWITWLPPLRRNGEIVSYTIIQNSEQHTLSCSTTGICPDDDQSELRFELKDLSSFTNYTINVTATTVKESLPSNNIQFRTLIGIPSNPRDMMSYDLNNTLQWVKPEVPSGRVEYYEVKSTWSHQKQKKVHIDYIFGSTACVYERPFCNFKYDEFSLEVRAVNLALRGSEVDVALIANHTDKEIGYINYTQVRCVGTSTSADKQLAAVRKYLNNNQYIRYNSDWVKGIKYGCTPSARSSMDWGLFLIIIGAIIVLSYFFVRGYKFVKTMSQIEIQLPPDYNEKDKNINRDNDEFRRSKESIDKNENDRLLSSLSYDHGFLGSEISSIDTRQTCPSTSIATSSDYIESDPIVEECGIQQQEVQSIPIINSSDISYMVMNTMEQVEKSSLPKNLTYVQLDDNGYLPQTVILPGNGYVKPNQIFKPQEFSITSQHDDVTHTSSHGTIIPVEANGYVTTQMFQNTTAQSPQPVDGYTRLDALGKSILVNPQLQLATSPLPPPNIGGYVTQKHLSAFNQQRCS